CATSTIFGLARPLFSW
nr:immunoglobulin heavy chain junction region [Macaca mulatta]MOV41055.1 immunoglobulin heavy chain junction region [Macaca mulatta]MOV41152.1 immunoglobulin heavy chain junction region [Macaca mulatta]MOV41162.1 immunoglobulin heavy chain junction region [Macaca mulatta]MOV43445.1 immunoglobulin heavy chain junction region [Macaca mulatta]